MKLRKSIGLAAAFLLSGEAVWAAGYEWNVASEVWGDFGAVESWLCDGAAATAVPGEGDWLMAGSAGLRMYMDLGGVERRLSNWTSNVDWADRRAIRVRNGVLSFVGGTSNTHGDRFEIENGAAIQFISGATFVPALSDGAEFGLWVGSGGRFTVDETSTLSMYKLNMTVEAGGEATVAGPIKVCDFTGQENRIVNAGGTLSFPNGLAITGNPGAASTLTVRNQDGGTLVLGGPVSFETSTIPSTLAMDGGTVEVTGNVTFGFTTTTMAGDVLLNVADGASISLAGVTMEEGARVTKTGEGILYLDAVGTNCLAAVSGGIGVAGHGCTLDVSDPMYAGVTKIVLGDYGTTMETMPSASTVTFAQQISTIEAGVPILTTSNPALLEKVAQDLATDDLAARGVTVIVSGDSVVFSPVYVFNSTTITDLTNPDGWQCGYVPVGEEAFISGAGVKASVIMDNIPAFASLTVSDGAEMEINSSITLPELTLTSNGRLSVGAGGFTVTIADPLHCVARDAEAVPSLAVAEGSTLIVPSGFCVSNVWLELNGTLSTPENVSGPITIGYAASGATTYLGLTAGPRAVVRTYGSGGYNDSMLRLVRPAENGCVLPLGELVIGATQFFVPDSWDGVQIGVNNPTNVPVSLVLDGGEINYRGPSTLAGGVTLTLRNGASFNKWATSSAWVYLTIEGAASLRVESGGWVRTTGDYYENHFRSAAEPALTAEAGATLFPFRWNLDTGSSILLNGADLVMTSTERTFQNAGFSDLFYGNGFAELGAGTETVLRQQSSWLSDKAYNRISCLSGAGDFAVTNEISELYTLIVCGNNPCTGTIRSCGESARLAFDNGTVWGGLVVADGSTFLTNTTAEAEAGPVTNSWGGVALTGPLTIRYWAEGLAGEEPYGDILNLGASGARNDGGCLQLKAAGSGELFPGTRLYLGTIATGAEVPVLADRNWRVVTTPLPENETLSTMEIVYSGMTLIRLR